MINICCLIIFILCKEKIEARFVSLISREFMALNQKLVCQQIDKKTEKIRTAKHIFSQV